MRLGMEYGLPCQWFRRLLAGVRARAVDRAMRRGFGRQKFGSRRRTGGMRS